MTIDDLSWMADWAVGVRVWLERASRAVLDPGRLELLEGIDRWCSISAGGAAGGRLLPARLGHGARGQPGRR